MELLNTSKARLVLLRSALGTHLTDEQLVDAALLLLDNQLTHEDNGRPVVLFAQRRHNGKPDIDKSMMYTSESIREWLRK